MSVIRLPVDFESETQFRLLISALRAAGLTCPEARASRLYVRLFVDLAREARATNSVGVLGAAAAGLFVESTRDTSDDPLAVLTAAGVLEARGPDWFCAAFNRGAINADCAGNFVKPQLVGALRSGLVRNGKRIQETAGLLAMTLLREDEKAYQSRAGIDLTLDETNRAVNVIITLDHCLQRQRGVTKAHYSPGLVTNAHAVRSANSDEDLKRVYNYILEHRDSLSVPKTTEQVLELWESIARLSREG